MSRKRPPRRPTALAALLAALAVTAAAAQQQETGAPPSGFTERVDVELVTVDVWVTDADGNPVTGLDAGSFTVLHDGQPARVTHFGEVRSAGDGAEAAAAGDAAAPQGFLPIATPPGHLVVYFDRSRIHPSRYPALIDSLRRFLDAEAIASDRVLVLRQDRALAVEASFGSSRQELEEAFARIARGTPGGMSLETETRQALAEIRDAWDHTQDLVGSAMDGLAAVPGTAGEPGGSPNANQGAGPRAVVGGVGSGSGPDACGMFVTQIQPTLEAWAGAYRQQIEVTLTNLSSAAGFLAGLPGVKALLYLADGLQTQPASDLATYASNLCPGAGAELLTGRLADKLSSGFLDLTRHASTNRVTIYSLQTSGLRGLATSDASAGRGERGGGGPRARRAFEASKRTADRDGLALLATETGGRAVFGQNDLSDELTRIGRETQAYYSLAYEPPPGGTGDDRRAHSIKVRLADSSLTARYRRGYLEKDRRQWLTERIEGALNLGLTDNPLEVRLGAGEIAEAEPGSYRVPLHVMVPAEKLAFLADGGSFFADITVRVMTRPLDGMRMLIEDREFRVGGSPQATGFASLQVELTLPAGTQVMALGVQDANTREASFISTTLQLGPGSG